MRDIIAAGLEELGLSQRVPPEAPELLEAYGRALLEKNQVMNLTAITQPDQVARLHMLDCAALLNYVHLEGKTLLDVGTGAGFPGIPLKIAFPHLKITLLDSLNKRIKFLDEVIRELGLQEIKTIHGRAEDFAKQKEYREQYDLCVSRAVANLATLSEYCIPYTKVGGQFISYKSGEIQEEIDASRKAVSILGGTVADVVKFQLPGSDIGRSFVVIKKEKATAKKYPRKAGLPAKEPLK